MTIRSAYLLVRTTSADHVVDDEIIASGHPSLPLGWECHNVDAGWVECRRDLGGVFHVLRINTVQQDPTKGLWLVVQREPEGRELLDLLATAPGNDYAQPAKTVWALAQSGDATARAIMRHWCDWRVQGFVSDGIGGSLAIDEPVRIFPRDSGTRLPVSALAGDPGPWHFAADGSEVAHLDASEVLHVTSWGRPALLQTIAGFDDDTAVEVTDAA